MNTDKIQEILKNYRSYRYAVSNGIAGWNPYDSTGMPMGGSFGSRIPSLSSGTTLFSNDDFMRYGKIVNLVDGVIRDVLDDNEAMVINRKYIDRNSLTFEQIADLMFVHRQTVANHHKSALKKFNIILELFIDDAPEIINLDDAIFSNNKSIYIDNKSI